MRRGVQVLVGALVVAAVGWWAQRSASRGAARWEATIADRSEVPGDPGSVRIPVLELPASEALGLEMSAALVEGGLRLLLRFGEKDPRTVPTSWAC